MFFGDFPLQNGQKPDFFLAREVKLFSKKIPKMKTGLGYYPKFSKKWKAGLALGGG